jgi:hypothetical protein
MTRSRAAAIAVALLLVLFTDLRAAPESTRTSTMASGFERYRYSIAARVRPLLVFWITRSGVGDAVVTRRRAPGETSYSLLIGSDPDRAPRRINRWGYIEETIHGGEAQLIGLMTKSDEDTVEQAEAGLKSQAAGHHPFKIIQATVTRGQASSRVTSIPAPENYTFRQLDTVLGLVGRASTGGRSRVLALPPDTRPGFLAALADAMHASSQRPIRYVYDGRLYELRETHMQQEANLQVGQASYGRAIAADFVITSEYDGERTPFSMTYGLDGRFAEVPLSVRYQPRWWMQVELTIENTDEEPARSEGTGR